MENFSEFDRQGQAPITEVGSIISHAWENYKGIFGYTLLYALIGAIAYGILSIFLPGSSENVDAYKEIIESVKNGESIDLETISEMQSNMGIGSRVLTGLLGVVFGALLYPLNAGLMYIAHKYNFRKQIDISDLFIGFRQNTMNLILYGAMVTLLATIGLYLCVLPGIYIYIASFIGLPIIFFENKTAVDALKKSFSITNSNFGIFLGAILLSWLISVSGIILCCVGILLTMGFNMSVKYSLYSAFCGTPYELNK